MNCSCFVFDSINGLRKKCHRISLNRGGSYVDSTDWIKNKKAAINPKNSDDKCFQYVVAGALNYKNIAQEKQRTLKIKLFINKYNWKETSFPTEPKDWIKI